MLPTLEEEALLFQHPLYWVLVVRGYINHHLQITTEGLSYGSAGYLIDSLCV